MRVAGSPDEGRLEMSEHLVTDEEAEEMQGASLSSAEGARLLATRAALMGVVGGAPALIGVLNVEGRRSIAPEMLAAFVLAYNAWSEEARTLLAQLQGGSP